MKLKQRCRGLVWWPGINRDIKAMVKECATCLFSGKTSPLAPPPLQLLVWPTRPWEHVQLDICGEIHGVPHHQRFLVVAYDLHSNWPEVIPMGMVITRAMVDILDMLFACWGLPQDVTPDNGPQFTLAEFPSFVVGCELQLPLDRLQPSAAQAPANNTQAAGKKHQHKMKQCFDRAHRATAPTIQVLNWVRTGRLHRDNKLRSFWSMPLQDSHQPGLATLQLTDGSRWHAS